MCVKQGYIDPWCKMLIIRVQFVIVQWSLIELELELEVFSTYDYDPVKCGATTKKQLARMTGSIIQITHSTTS